MDLNALPSPMRKARVLLVDDHPLFREGLAYLINGQPDMQVCGTASNIADGLALVRANPAQILVLDITLKGPSGLELIKEIEAQNINVSILVLSGHEESLYAERTLRAGARGYISKDEPPEKVISAIRQVLNGQTYLSPQMTAKILRTFSNGPAHIAGVAALTDRELEVFEQIGRGRTTREIGARLHLGASTVETYRARIKTKLNLENATQLSHEAVRWVQAHQEPSVA
jgi:DNA-binding NarL/FixJ family response regulator